MRPFNLEAAKAGAPLVTRSGKPATKPSGSFNADLRATASSSVT